METLSKGYALICVQNALLGVVTPELRAVIVDFNPKEPLLYIRFYHHGEVSEETMDLWLCAISEASAHFGPDCLLDDGVERIDYPKKIPVRGCYAYLRKE